MNENGPPRKREGRPARTALRKLELKLAGVYRNFRFPQPKVRLCTACGCRVSNRNLGGYDGRSALTGSLWCYGCADSPPPTFLAILRAAA